MPLVSRAAQVAALLLLVGATGCGDDIGPSFEPEVVNTQDAFSFQVAGMNDVTGTRQYTWQNTGTTAVVTRTTSVSAGNGTLTILDANGSQVYSAPLITESSGSSQSGAPGAWTIRVELTEADGGFNFTVAGG